jgi:peptidoglycan hydrolase-like protein with peptidoglycan-binding domain
MKKFTNKQMIYAGAILAGIIGLGVYLYKKKKLQKYTSAFQSGISTVTGGIIGNDSFPLKMGSRGTNVKSLQTILNKKIKGLEPLAIDGIFGAKTEAALKQVTGKISISQSEFDLLQTR